MKAIGKLLKKLISFVFVLVILVTISIILWISFFPVEPIAQIFVNLGLSSYNYGHANLRVKKLSFNQLELHQVNVGDPQNFQIKKLRASYDYESIKDKNIELIEIEGLKLEANKKANNILSLGNLDQLIKDISEASKLTQGGQQPASQDAIFNIKKLVIEESLLIINGPKQILKLPFSLVLDPEKENIVLNVRLGAASLELKEMIIPATGLISVNAKFSGQLPFEWRDQRFLVDDGQIYSTDIGSIKFEPVFIPTNDSVKTLLDAITDYRYSYFKIILNYNEDNELESNLKLEGANQGYLDGRMVRINVNLKTDLADTIREIIGLYKVSTDLQKSFVNMFKKNRESSNPDREINNE